MMKQNDEKFPKGIRVYKPHDNAPSFVKGELVVNVEELKEWLKTQKGLNVKLSIKEGRTGTWYTEINTFEPKKATPVAYSTAGPSSYTGTVADDDSLLF